MTLSPQILQSIAHHINETLSQRQRQRQPFEITQVQSLSGGDINQAYQILGSGQTYFLKVNRADRVFMFAAEAMGLQQIHDTQTIRVPNPICFGVADTVSYIVLEYLDLRGSQNQRQSQRQLGQNLARLHLTPGSIRFGWHQDNTIGSTPQVNRWTNTWSEFWQVHRIGYQLDLARKNGGRFDQGDRLLDAIPTLLVGHEPKPSLVHGDLWGGNAGATAVGEPVIFDPATYWGDREVDLAMTELFGGFSPEFYAGYAEVYPIDPGYPSRKPLYNLYHILNHFNLFGGSYAGQADRLISSLLCP